MRILIWMVVTLLAQASVAQDDFKVMTYNIGKGIGVEKEKIKEFQQWMKYLDMDVAAFQNVQKTDLSNFTKIAKKWKHRYIAIKEFDGYATIVTSKTPIVSTVKAEQLMATIKDMDIDIYVLDLQQDSIADRTRIAKAIAADVKGKEKAIVLGHLNGYAPADSLLYNRRFRMIPNNARSDSKLIQQIASYQRTENYAVLHELLNVGVNDIYAAKGKEKAIVKGTYPTKVFGVMPQYNKHRYDYILATKSLQEKCQRIEVLETEKTDFLSSHYPVIATFVLEQ